MTKILIYEVMVREDKKEIFEEMMKGQPKLITVHCVSCPYAKGNFSFRDTGFFRITNLNSWINGSQESLDH